MIQTLDRLQVALAGRYVLQRELGAGGMATVYLAQDEQQDRLVAVKVLRPELAASLGGDRFLREIELAGVLQHPHIMGIYESGEADGLLYYVMPYIEGESLRDRLDRERQLPVETAIRITVQAAEALAYAHGKGVVHRDIKPENILLRAGGAAGGGDDVIVADFGVARAVTVAGGEKLTRTGMAVGTPTYMSPEQAAGGREATPASDQYSLGCVLYEMLAGQPPFTGPTPMAIMARHSLDEMPSLKTVRATIPDEVEDAIHRALEKVPADRYASITDFATALTAPPGSRPAKRPGRGRARGSAAHEAPAGRGRRFAVLGVALAALAGGGAWAFLRTPAAAAGAAGGGLDPRHVAVLYFDDLSADGGLRHLADGLTHALINELGNVPTLQVISRNGVLAFKGKQVPSDSVARALRVGTMVEGAVTQAGDSLRVEVAMVNSATGAQIGSTRLTRPRSDVIGLQDDLAREVAVFLRQQLGEEVEVRSTQASTRNAAAWEAFQRAQEVADGAETLRTSGDAAAADRELVRADSLLAQVEQLDRKWPRPTIERGWLTYQRWRLADASEQTIRPDPYASGMELAEHALSLAPRDADALELRGTLRYYRWLGGSVGDSAASERLLGEAEQDLRAATEASRVQAQAWSTLSHLLLAKAQTAEGKLAAQRAYEADPWLTSANLVLWRLFSSSLDLEDPTEAEKWCTEGQQRFPEDPRFQECQLWQFTFQGQTPDIERAWALAQRYEELSPPDLREFRRLRARMIIAMALGRAGLADSARAVAASAEGNPRVDPDRELLYFGAFAHNILGDREEAIRLLARYLASNPQQRSSLAKDQSWWLRDLRSDPRYKRLVGTRS